jgi:hypothetical protein
MIYKYKYSVDNDCYRFTYNCELKSELHVPHITVLVEKCAQHYFDNSDTKYHEWPKIFTLYDSAESELGRFEVEMELIPSFYVVSRLFKTKEKQS